MEYHDYHLRGYSVANFGADLVLDLLYRYEGQPERESRVHFSGVRFHHFEFTAPAILTSIEEMPVGELVGERSSQFQEWATRQGVMDWSKDAKALAATWEQAGLRAWQIDSAIGFSGFVVGEAMR